MKYPGAYPIDVIAVSRPDGGRPLPSGFAADVGGDPAAAALAGGVAPTYSIAPPWIDPPADATDFLLNGRTTVTGPSSPWTELASIEIDQTAEGVLKSLNVAAVGTLAATSEIQFRVLIGGGAVPGWEQITLPPLPGTGIGRTFDADETAIRVPAGVTLAVQARVLDGASYLLDVAGHGWSWGVA